MKKTKTGRRASQDERDRVLALVRAYRKDNPEQGALVQDGENPARMDDECLVAALNHFAKHGTFANVFDGRHIQAQRIAEGAGPRYEDKVRAVADGLNTSERNAERLLAK